MSFRPKIYSLILLFSFFLSCHSNDTSIATTIVSPTTIPSSININEELQKAAALNKALTDMREVFESKEPFIKNLKKLLDASRMCGIIFHHGIDSWDQLQSHQEINSVTFYFNLISTQINYIWKRSFDYAEKNLASRHEIIGIQRGIIIPIQNLANLFGNFKKFDNLKQKIDDLKTGCRWYDPITILMTFRYDSSTLLDMGDDYTDQTFENLKTIFQKSLKLTIAMFPFCQQFLHGEPNDFSLFAVDILKMINEKFNTINNQRKINFWKNEIIEKLIQKHVTNGQDKNNTDIQQNIFNELYTIYGSLGYNFHVTVSNAAQFGHNDTVLHCSTECRYLYNFLGKDIYVIRTLKTKNNNYSTCQFLDQFQPFYGYCGHENNSTDSLEPLAKEIAEKCGDKIVAISLIRDRLALENRNMYDHDKNGFALLCKDDIYILIAFKPL